MIIRDMRKVNHGKLRAFFVVEWPDKLAVRDFKLIEGNDGQLFSAAPSREYEKDGQKKYAPVVEVLDAGLREKITAAARSEYFGSQDQDEEPPF